MTLESRDPFIRDWHPIKTMILPPTIFSGVFWSAVALACNQLSPTPQYSPGRAVIVNVNSPTAPYKPREATCTAESGTGPAPTAC